MTMKKSNQVKVLYNNARSVQTHVKMSNYNTVASDSICLSETWLKFNDNDTIYDILSYIKWMMKTQTLLTNGYSYMHSIIVHSLRRF